jgi:hypothetical protein
MKIQDTDKNKKNEIKSKETVIRNLLSFHPYNIFYYFQN